MMEGAQGEHGAWFPDPLNRSGMRFHNGTHWTDQTSPLVDGRLLPQQPGWYPDPLSFARLRHFDGTRWTDDVRPMVVPGPDIEAPQPVPTPAPAQPVAPSVPVQQLQGALVEPSPRSWKGPALWAAGGLVAFAAAVGIGVAITGLIVDSQSGNEGVEVPGASSTTNSAEPSPSAQALEGSPSTTGAPVVQIVRNPGQPQIGVPLFSVAVSGLDPVVKTPISERLDRFVKQWTSKKFVEGPPVSVPGVYDVSLEQVPCSAPFLCLIKRGSTRPPSDAGSYEVLQTFVVNYETADYVGVRAFVPPNQMNSFTELVRLKLLESGVSLGDEFPNLEAKASQYPNVIPRQKGLSVYFDAGELAPEPIEIFVRFELVGIKRSF